MALKTPPNWLEVYQKLIAVWVLLPEDEWVREPLGDTLDAVWRRMTPAEQQLSNGPRG